jgi:phosphatidylserine/phosphatidylglycerophosphate/cardiolipin synthase-like enzyme
VKRQLPPEGPRPIVTFLILICCIIILGMLFAAIRVFLLPQQTGILQENGSIEVTFCPTGPCEVRLRDELTRSTTSACVFYELNLPSAIETLKSEHTDLLLYDEEAKPIDGLMYRSVPSKGLMHNKFCVLDLKTDPHLITGSMNPTENDALSNDNNLLVIHSASLAQRYQREFDEMASRKSADYRKNTPRPFTLNLSGSLIEQRFCPQEHCEAAVAKRIDSAQHEVVFMIFTFTSDEIGDRMVAAKQRGIVVQGVMEKRQISEYAERDKLAANGIDVRLDGNGRTMHHKVLIIDNRTVITGSFNPTQAAEERNDENLIIIDDEALAAKYRSEYERVLAASTG